METFMNMGMGTYFLIGLVICIVEFFLYVFLSRDSISCIDEIIIILCLCLLFNLLWPISSIVIILVLIAKKIAGV